MPSSSRPIVFHYPGSIYSYRVLWYLWLRGIPFDECIQPHVMPRPDLASIDVHYRRMPLMAIGKDVYIDSRLIISKLESLYPHSSLTPSTPAGEGIRKLLENWTIDGGIFWRTVQLMPYWKSPGILQDKAFLDDREKLSGQRMTAEGMEANRPDGLQHMRQVFETLENTFLADDRKWILSSEEPTLADLDGVWPLSWLIADPMMGGALTDEFVNEQKYPRTYAWVLRFMDEVNSKKAEAARPGKLDGAAMRDAVLNSSSASETEFVKGDPLKLEFGDEVEIFPSDYGQAHKDRGAVIGLTLQEVVIRNTKGLHLHFPRWNFRISKVTSAVRTSISSTVKQPKLQLIYHHASPYTRKVYMLALELGLAKRITLQKVVVCPIPFPGWSDNNEDVAAYNPMAKIPCLVPEDVPDGIFDSRVICEYLSHLAGMKDRKNQQHWQLRTLHACADGIMDAAVLIIYELRIRKQRGLQFDEWIEGQKTKMRRGLDRFEVAASSGILLRPIEGKVTSADEIAVAIATALTESMPYLELNWRRGRPNLEQWMKGWEGRKSFMETPPDKEWDISDMTNTSKI